jgi:hypothetical protein
MAPVRAAVELGRRSGTGGVADGLVVSPTDWWCRRRTGGVADGLVVSPTDWWCRVFGVGWQDSNERVWALVV